MRTREKQKFMADAMNALEMNQTQFGRELGIEQPQVSGLLSGTRTIKNYHVLAIEGLLVRYGVWPLQ